MVRRAVAEYYVFHIADAGGVAPARFNINTAHRPRAGRVAEDSVREAAVGARADGHPLPVIVQKVAASYVHVVVVFQSFRGVCVAYGRALRAVSAGRFYNTKLW